MAAALAVPLLNSASMEDVMTRRSLEALEAAKTADAVEDGSAEISARYGEDPWLAVR